MSVDLYVFFRSRDLLSREQWQRAIADCGLQLTLDDFDSRHHSGYLPVTFKGKRTGFEYAFGPAAEEAGESFFDSSRVGDRDSVAHFISHSDPIEGEAALHAAAVLTKGTAGVFHDPQSNEYAEGDDVFDLLQQDEAAERQRLQQQAERDRTITDRRCPECGAPCPSYRQTCRVCRHPIGRSKGLASSPELTPILDPMLARKTRGKKWWQFWK